MLYKVILVDDEFMIVDGIASVMDWEGLGTELVGTAQNGVEALALAEREWPDLIITDIRMPGMDGLQLVAAASERLPDASFIMLTGFSEFKFAQSAMQYGVKHYLLKPCSEESLSEAVAEIVREKRERDSKQHFVQKIKAGLERMLPHAKEQFLKELVTNKTYGEKEWQLFGELFGLPFRSQRVRLLLLELEGELEFEHLFAVKNIADDLFPHPLLSTTVGTHVLVMMEDELPEDELFAKIDAVREAFTAYYRLDLTAALSEPGLLLHVRQLYAQALDCLHHRFYLGQGSLITKRDIAAAGDKAASRLDYEPERLIMAVRAGHWKDAEAELLAIFRELLDARYDVPEAKSYIIQLCMEIVRLCEPDLMKRYMEQLPDMLASSTLPSLQQFVLAMAKETALARYDRNRRKHSHMVETVKAIVERSYGDETLTLQSVAKEVYMNPDYISKMFKKETGEKFTNYVTGVRIGKALERIEKRGDFTIGELAEEVGYGDNVSYFSKIFKKFTGFSPSEYKKTT